MVVSPRYASLSPQHAAQLADLDRWVRVDLGNGANWVNFHAQRRDGVDWLFVQHAAFDRSGGLYGDDGGDYSDNLHR